MAIDIVQGKSVPIKLWTKYTDIEEQAQIQLQNIAALPWCFSHVAVMPDCHFGKGATVGSVIAMKDAVAPSAVGVDIGCFTGDTEIIATNSRPHKLSDLEGQELDIFAYCQETKTIVVAKAKAKKTRLNAELVKVTLDSEKSVRCTPDHEFMLRDGLFRRADELKPNDSLMPFCTTFDRGLSENHRVISIEYLSETEDVYCLTVPIYSNFALAIGVFVHNCGMGAVLTTLTSHDLPSNLRGLRDDIEAEIPVGFNMHKEPALGAIDSPLWSEFGQLDPAIHGEKDRALRQVGTLGGGNHFIELCLDTGDHVWMMLHSGSRGIGNRLAEVHIARARKLAHNAELPDKDLAVFLSGTPEMAAYHHDLYWAQRYAFFNRQIMLDLYRKILQRHFKQIEFHKPILCHHNYLTEEIHFGESVFVTRKGAIRAGKGDLGIIPGSMGTRSFIVRGLGNPDSFESASHGAGRKMSRGKAKRTFTTKDLEALTKGVECRKDKDVIDEIPAAYKDIEKVMANQCDLVEILHELHGVLCVKG